MKSIFRMIVIVAGLFLTVGPALADKAQPYEIPRSEVRAVTSVKTGRAYDIYVKLPPAYSAEVNSRRRYPVVYLNDGTYCFQTAAGVTHMPMNFGGFEHFILVGISYANGESGVASRSRDMTPTALGKNGVGHGAEYQHGGAREYLDFLRDELIPFVEREYRADPARRTLVGQSYGGLFGAYALLAEPELFSGYILTSPSLWFGDWAMFEIEEKFSRSRRPLNARVYFAVGERESPSSNKDMKNNMVEDQSRFAAILRGRAYEGLEVRDEIIGGATHQTTFPIGLVRGLMWLHEGPKP